MKKEKKKESNSIDLAYIVDVSVLTNPVIIIWKHCFYRVSTQFFQQSFLTFPDLFALEFPDFP